MYTNINKSFHIHASSLSTPFSIASTLVEALRVKVVLLDALGSTLALSRAVVVDTATLVVELDGSSRAGRDSTGRGCNA